jgi:putative membrane protein
VPRQRFSGIGLDHGQVIKSAVQGTGAGIMVGWLPGLSTASASAVVQTCIRYDSDQRRYLVATGSASLVNAVVALAAFFAIGRTRNGVMAALSSLDTPSYPVLLLVCAFSSLIAYLVTVRLAGCAGLFSGMDAKMINTLVGGFVVLLCGLFTGPFGLMILVCATGMGLVPYLLNLPRVTCMGAVTLPVILYSLGFGGF